MNTVIGGVDGPGGGMNLAVLGEGGLGVVGLEAALLLRRR